MKTIFHGGTDAIEHPLVDIGRDGLDFGKGFYATEIYEQAQAWANKNARRKRMSLTVLKEAWPTIGLSILLKVILMERLMRNML